MVHELDHRHRPRLPLGRCTRVQAGREVDHGHDRPHPPLPLKVPSRVFGALRCGFCANLYRESGVEYGLSEELDGGDDHTGQKRVVPNNCQVHRLRLFMQLLADVNLQVVDGGCICVDAGIEP